MIFDKRMCRQAILLLTGLSSSIAFSASQPASQPVSQPINFKSILNSTTHYLSTLPASLKKGHPILQLGGYWGIAGDTQHINIQGLVGNTYTANHQTDGNILVGAGYFLDGQVVRSAQLSYGLNWFYLGRANYSGTVTQEDLFTNLSYQYDITHYPLYAIVKSTMAMTSKLPQYKITVDVGIGPNFIKTGSYQETPINNNSIPNTPFPGKTTTTFSTTVGVGIKRNNVFGRVPLECGYRFFYLG